MPEEVKAVRSTMLSWHQAARIFQTRSITSYASRSSFRGALDVGATTINEDMKKGCRRCPCKSIAEEETSDVVLQAYGAESLIFGPEYIIPKPFDPRLITKIAPAVAKAAVDSGVATRPIEDIAAYREKLDRVCLSVRFHDEADL